MCGVCGYPAGTLSTRVSWRSMKIISCGIYRTGSVWVIGSDERLCNICKLLYTIIKINLNHIIIIFVLDNLENIDTYNMID